MNLLAIVMILVINALILLIPYNLFFKDKNMKLILVTMYLSLVMANYVVGALFSIIVVLIFLAYLWWTKLLSSKDKKWKKVLFIITKVLVIFFTVLNTLHLPLKIYLGSPEHLIVIKIFAVLFWFTCLFIILNCRKIYQSNDSIIVKENE